MEAIYIEGTIIAILPETRGVSSKGEWASQDFVLKTDENYPKNICFTVFGADKIQEANIQMGDVVSIGINIESREFKGRWYTSVRAWSVKKRDEAKTKQSAYTTSTSKAQPEQNNSTTTNRIEDDLPF